MEYDGVVGCLQLCARVRASVFCLLVFFVFALPLVVAVAGLVWSGNHFVT